jgi:hypothetical protein
MGVMRTVLGLVMIGIVVIIVGYLLLRRRGRDEIHSIDNYRHALDTLQEMRGPMGSSIRILSDDEVAELRKPTPMPVIRSDATTAVPPRIPPPADSTDGMVFDELGAPAEPRVEAEEHHRGLHHHEDPHWAINRMDNRRPVQNREIKAAVAALVVLVILVIAGIAIGRSNNGSTATSTTTTLHHVTTTTQAPTTTTAPAPTSFSPEAGATATAATYLVPGSAYTVTVTPSNGACWTIATAASGSQIFAGTVAAGSPQEIKGASGLSISLGAPAGVSVKVNGIPVNFPSNYSVPLVLSFINPPPTTTTTTSTTLAPAPTTTSPPTTRVP